MGKVSFENYGILAEKADSATIIAGRYKVQASAERLIVGDIKKKLAISPEDNILEIGCGIGNLLAPISFMVNTATGIDNQSVVDNFIITNKRSNICLIGSNFLEYTNTSYLYDKILIYSVLHCLSNIEEAILFCKKALAMLRPGGLMLIGDIPNIDLKKRFLSSERGMKFRDEWEEKMKADSNMNKFAELKLEKDPSLFDPDDKSLDQIKQCLQDKGATVYSLPQPNELPFGNTRHDLLVELH